MAVDISIHALHEESDAQQIEQATGEDCISIHALHEESDSLHDSIKKLAEHFNPRSP